MRHNFFILWILLGLLSASAAGRDDLLGRVTDAVTGEPVAGAVVKSKGAFASTDSEGYFRIRLNEGADSVSFRSIGYETLTLPVSADMSAVRLQHKATVLKDVIVEAPDIYARGDTLVFNVERYANAKDNAIIDVLKRLPGIKVEEDGTIKYQGKPISKFYIDGNDFIGGQYGLATNNISHKDVKSVEVMENHQPVKALEGIEFPEEAGINLKLKEDARSRWVGVAQAAAGIEPLVCDGSMFTMRIAPRIQNMFTVKADNTGWNPANEIRERDFLDMFNHDYTSSLWPEYISADIINAPLSEKRTRDNLSWLANGISAWRSGDTSLRMKLNYMADRLDYNSGVTTDYLDSGIPAFVQRNSMRSQTHDLSAQINSETNRREYFLKDRLTVNAVWDNTSSAITGTADLRQTVDRTTLSAINDMKLVKRNEKRLFMLTSRNSFTRRPDRLLVDGNSDIRQSIGTSDFRSTTETQIGRLKRFWKYYMTAGMDIDYHHMNTSLIGMGGFDNAEVYNAFLSDLYATPQVDYERLGWRISFKMPIRWLHQSIRGRHDYINLSPHLYLHRQLSARSELSGSITYRLGSPQPYLNISAPILSDYRNLLIASTDGKYTRDIAASATYRFRNPLKALFINASASYNHRHASTISDQLFIDDIIVTAYTDRASHSDSWYLDGGISKGLGHSRIVVGCDVNATISEATAMRDNEAIPYRQLTTGIKPYFKGSLLRCLSASYEASYSISKLDINHASTDYHSLTQKIFATILPTDNINFTAGAEHFLTRFPEGNTSSMVLLDASAIWRMNAKIRLTLTATNLLNCRRYEYVKYGTLSRSEYSFAIRRRNIIAAIQYRF